ncbi:hypothetical protein DFH09DRAFT_1282334 [Mycena vulgaris]|nr:hypothetical protein DFH09DRAFT_1282334 [Mycena vulgaris]
MTSTNFAIHDPFASFASSSSLVRKRWGYDDLDERNRPTKRVRSSPRIRQRRPRRAPPNPAASHSSLIVPSLTSHRPLLIPTIFRREQQEDLYYRHHDQYGRSFVPQPPNAVHTTVPSPMEDVEMLTPPPVPYTEEEYAAVCAAATAQMLEFSSPSPSPPSSAPAFICPGASSPGWVALCDDVGPSLYAACDDDGDMEISEVEKMEDRPEQLASADSNIGASEKDLVESRVDKGKTPTFVPELVLITASPSLESPVMTHRIDPALLFTAFQQPAPVQDASEAGPSRSADKNVESASMGKGVRMTQARPTTTKIGSSTSSTNSNGRKKGKENIRPNPGTQAATAATDETKRVALANVQNTSSSRSSASTKPPLTASPKTHVFIPLPAFVVHPSAAPAAPAASSSSHAPKLIQHMVFRDRPALVLPQSSHGARASSSAPAVEVEVEKEVVLEAKEVEPVHQGPRRRPSSHLWHFFFLDIVVNLMLDIQLSSYGLRRPTRACLLDPTFFYPRPQCSNLELERLYLNAALDACLLASQKIDGHIVRDHEANSFEQAPTFFTPVPPPVPRTGCWYSSPLSAAIPSYPLDSLRLCLAALHGRHHTLFCAPLVTSRPSPRYTLPGFPQLQLPHTLLSCPLYRTSPPSPSLNFGYHSLLCSVAASAPQPSPTGIARWTHARSLASPARRLPPSSPPAPSNLKDSPYLDLPPTNRSSGKIRRLYHQTQSLPQTVSMVFVLAFACVLSPRFAFAMVSLSGFRFPPVLRSSPALAFGSAAVLSRFGRPALVLVSSQVGSPSSRDRPKSKSEAAPVARFGVHATLLLYGLFRSPAITPSQTPLISPVLPSSGLESQNFLLLTLVLIGFPDPCHLRARQITVKSNVSRSTKIQNERMGGNNHQCTNASGMRRIPDTR